MMKDDRKQDGIGGHRRSGIGPSAAIGTLITMTLAFGIPHAVAQTAIPPAPKDFVTAMSQSDQYEIFAARAALVEGHNPDIRKFAERIIQDHTKTSEDLKQAAAKSGLPPPSSGLGDQAMFLNTLQSVTGKEFEKAYAKQQVLAHTQAVTVGESFAEGGADPNLKAAAKAALPTLRDHLKMAQKLAADIGE